METRLDHYTPELLLLIQRYLARLPGQRYADIAQDLHRTLTSDETIRALLPARRTITGESKPSDYDSFSFNHTNSSFRHTLRNVTSLLSTRGSNEAHNYRAKLSTGLVAPPPRHRPCRLSNLEKVRMRQTGARLGPRLLANGSIWSKFERQCYTLGHLDQVCLVTLDKRGEVILTGSDEGLIKLWSIKSGLLIKTLRGHSGEVMDMQIHPDNTLLASCDDKKIIRIWCLKSGACVDILSAHTNKVTTIEWSPAIVTTPNGSTVRVLLSTGNDCMVIFWSFNEKDKKFDSGQPIRFCERTKSSDKATQQAWTQGGRIVAVGFNDGRIRIYMIHPPWLDKEKNPIERIDELADHVGLISGLYWAKTPISSQNRPRLLSGSFDGMARIWTYQRRQWVAQCMDCTAGYQGDPKKRPKVNDAIWLDRDRLVATAVTGEGEHNVIKLWLAVDCQLVHTFFGHREMIRCLQPHPIYPATFVSVGCDGHVFVWDVTTRQRLQEVYYPSTVETGEPVQIHDAKWNHAGDLLVTADSQGHLGIVGFGQNDTYRKLPYELFFETDYHPLVTDADGYVIDEHTGLAPHLTQPGLYTNRDNEPHDNFIYQGTARTENIQHDVLGERIRLLAHQLDAAQVAPQSLPDEPRMSEDDENSMPALPNTSRALCNDTVVPEENYAKPLCRPLDRQIVVQHNRRIRQWYTLEMQWYATERKKQPVGNSPVKRDKRPKTTRRTNATSPQSENEEPTLPSEDENQSIQGSDSEWAEPGNRPAPSANQRRPYRHVPSPTYYSQRRRQRKRKKKKRRRVSNVSESHSTFDESNERVDEPLNSDDDLIGSDEDMTDDSDQSENDDDSNESETAETESSEKPGPSRLRSQSKQQSPKQRTPAKSPRFTPRKRSTRKVIETDSESEFEAESSSPVPNRLTAVTRNLSREFSEEEEDALVALTLPNKQERKQSLAEMVQVNAAKEMEWITHTQSLRMPFIPQLNDHVYYVPRAHEKYCEDIERRLDYRLRINEKVPKEIRRLQLLDELVLCQVQSIEVDQLKTAKYREHPIRCLIIVLNVVGGEKDLSTLAIRYAPLKDCEEFLVYQQLYQDSVKSEFKVGSRCSALFENGEDQMEWFDGVITGKAEAEYEHQQYQVKWDSDGEVSSHSAWELMSPGSHDIRLSHYESLEQDNLERISRLLAEVIESENYHAFNNDVEKEFHDEYWREIAYPSCLNQIKLRIDSSYYRSLDALLWEVGLLHSNCAKFNGSDDDTSNGLFSLSQQLVLALSRVLPNEKLVYKDFVAIADEDIESDADEEESEEEISSVVVKKDKKKKLVVSDDEEEEESEHTPDESDDSPDDRNEENWRDEIRVKIAELNLTQRQQEKKINELVRMGKSEAMRHLSELDANLTHHMTRALPRKRYRESDDDDDEEYFEKENHKPKTRRVTKTTMPSEKRPRRQCKTRQSIEEQRLDFLDDQPAQHPPTTPPSSHRPTRERRRPARYSGESGDSIHYDDEDDDDSEPAVSTASTQQRKSSRTSQGGRSRNSAPIKTRKSRQLSESEDEEDSSDFEP